MREVRLEDVLAKQVEALARRRGGIIVVGQIGHRGVVAIAKDRVDQVVPVLEVMIERARARSSTFEQQRKRQGANPLVAHDLQRSSAYILVLAHKPISIA